ncbi:BAG family molecular chaperone regulator 3-like [Momordica charantia]|uniref:BAG family molecular chaperone regulator 3-like n=1 Tax=Momordica charantia TaxID=3673 RepID=A0A6J1CIU6_MOMCH|nr:BAG family molecular chaperone regulator 3-like [Momordica charantia]XP_022141327.1 BAG family molecular chaperone regulator 3-like [Momordica charantia]
MMKMKTKTTGLSQMKGSSAVGDAGGEPRPMDWELRPGGMLVQKRTPDSDQESTPPPTIRVKVKYGSNYHEISISSQATFGELKKMLVGPTGLHHQDQKLLFKKKERDSKAFLDISGVKNKSKIVLMEDPISQEKRYLEMRKNAKTEKASKSISEISLEVDRLAGQVSALESVVSKGGKVAENDVLNLIDLLMNELLKLDAIMGDGDVKLQRKMQVKRVQKYVETLDMLKIKNSMDASQIPTQLQHNNSSNHQRQTTRPSFVNSKLSTILEEQPPRNPALIDDDLLTYQQQPPQLARKSSTTSTTVVTTKWETFDSSPASSTSEHPVPPRFNWEFFD